MPNMGLIRTKRDGADRARRLAAMATSADERARMLAFADELDAQADALEGVVQGPPPSTVTRVQVQPPPLDDNGEKKKEP
jgi:hypothetical protein